MNHSPGIHEAVFHLSNEPMALVRQSDWQVCDDNLAFLRMLGRSETSRGQELATLLGVASPADLQPAGTVSAGGAYKVEVAYQRGNGDPISLELTWNPMVHSGETYGLLRLRDLTEENRQAALAQATQDRTRAQDCALLEIASDESFHLGDLRGALRTLTSLAADVLGIDRVSVWQFQSQDHCLRCLCLADAREPDHQEGETLQALDCPRFFGLLRSARTLTVEQVTGDARVAEIAGLYLEAAGVCSALYHPVRLEGRVEGFLGCEHRQEVRVWPPSEQVFVSALADLAALALSGQQHRQMENQLRHMTKMESVGRLAGGLAHDFNNILAAINGYTCLLLEETCLPENAREYAEQMKTATDMALLLTRKLMAMSRKQPMKLESLSLNKVVEAVSGILQQMVSRHGELRLELEPALPAVRLDAGLMEQTIVNLVVNARDALPRVGGRVVLSTRSQTMTTLEAARTPEARLGNFVVLSIQDNGCGMSEETLNRLFEPFFTTKAEGQGTGLGLSIVYGFVKQQDGWIEVSSELGQGTTFEIFLPITSAGPAEQPWSV